MTVQDRRATLTDAAATVAQPATIFAGLSVAEAERVHERLVATTCPAAAVLLQQGSWPGQLYILRQGIVSVDLSAPHGPGRHLARLVSGDCIGEMSLLTGQPASATITAVTDCDLWTLPQADFMELLATCPTLARNVAAVLSRRLASTNQGRRSPLRRLMQLTLHPALAPYLAESVARAAAFYGGRPLVVLDRRLAAQHWRSDERLPAMLATGPTASADHTLGSGPGGRVMAVMASELTLEGWERLLAWLPQSVDQILVIATADQPLLDLVGRDRLTVRSLTLWPIGEPLTGAQQDDIVLLGASATTTSRRELASASARCSARIVRLVHMATDDQQPAQRDIDWLGRHLAGQKVGLAFGGGGVRGVSHLGVIQALERAGVTIDAVAGCSSGGIVTSCYAHGYDVATMARDLEELAIQAVRFTVSRHSLLSSRGMADLWLRLLGETQIEDTLVPMALVAVDLNERRKIVLDRGPLWRALLASTAVPGVYPPVWVGERCLVDGGLLDVLPTSVVRDLGADIVIGANVTTASQPQALALGIDDDESVRPAMNMLEVLLSSFSLMTAEIGARAAHSADVILRANVDHVGLLDFKRRHEMIPAGEAAVAHAWPQLVQALPWLSTAVPEGT